jgi:cytochrome c oxidase subunit 2
MLNILDKYEKRVFAVVGSIIIIFIFSLLYAKATRQIDVPQCLPYNKAYETPKVVKLDSNLYLVNAVAQMWQFQPYKIYIPVGSTVDFYVTSRDVVHGFNIYEKNINMMAVYGNINKTTVKFEEPGVYKITCHEYCGVGHQNMQSEVIVNYPEAK